MKGSRFLKGAIIIIIILIISMSGSYAHDTIIFEVLDRNDGLSNLSVSSIIQDKYGFLWFGTQGGLNFYDGQQMVVYKNEPFKENDLVHNLIQTMFYDEENHILWIGTYNGVSKFVIDEKKFVNYTTNNSNLTNEVVIAIEKDRQGNIWFGTMNGLNRLDLETEKMESFDVPGEVIRDIHEDQNHNLWIGTYEGLYRFENNQLVKEDKDFGSPYVMVINEYDSNMLTLGLWNGGVVEYNVKDQEIVKQYSFTDNRIYSLMKDASGHILVGSWGGGLFEINGQRDNIIIEQNDAYKDFPSSVIYSLYEDSSNIQWIGTNGGGIVKMNPRNKNYVHFSSDNAGSRKIKPGKVQHILEDQRENIWFAIYNSGLNRYDPRSEKMYAYSKEEENLVDNSVIDMLITINNELIIADGAGLSIYDPYGDNFKSMNIFEKPVKAYALDEDQQGNLWVGTYYNGVYYYNRETQVLTQFGKGSISDDLVYDILVDSKNRVWVGTNSGLNVLNPGEDSFKTYLNDVKDPTTIPSNVIRQLHEDATGKIWMAMVGGGVAYFDDETDGFVSFTENEGLSSNLAVALNECINGNIWVSTHSGISIINQGDFSIDVLTPSDGIGGWEFNTGTLHSSADQLYFGGVHGVTIIPKNFVDLENPVPKVYINDIEVFGKSINPLKVNFNGEELTFKYSDRYLGFEFSTIYFDAPEQVKYEYQLEGFHDRWIQLDKRNYVSFSNLKPGDYILKVKAKAIKTDYSEVETVTFHVKRPWFFETWAFFLYALIFFLVLFMAIKIREWYLLKHKNSELSMLNDQLEKSNKALEEIATRDPLTGLYNRRYFNELMKDLINMAKRGASQLTFIMLDIDHFKDINDQYGHLAGDAYLEDVAHLLNSTLRRSTDFAVRYAGDEFALVLFDTDEEQAYKMAKSIQEEIRKIKIKPEFSNDGYTTTASMGMVCLDQNIEISAKELFKIADNALYTVKRRGRDDIQVITDFNYVSE